MQDNNEIYEKDGNSSVAITIKICYECKSIKNIKQNPFGTYLCYDCYLKDKEIFYKQELKKTILLPEMVQITKKIFIGNSDSGRMKETLLSNGLSHILMVGTYLFPHFPELFTYKNIELEDVEDEDISLHFSECFNFIDNSTKILIHCHAGVSRSASILIAYLMWKDKKPFEKVFNFIKKKKKNINTNLGFRKILAAFDLFLVQNNYTISEG